MSASKKDLEELAKAWDERFMNLENLIGEGSDPRQPKTSSGEDEGGRGEVAIYRCRNGNCTFSSDDIGGLIAHNNEHLMREVEARLGKLTTPKEPKEESWEEKTEPKRHKTAEDYVNCPDCGPKIEKVLEAKGWKRPEEKKPKKGLGL